MKKLTYGFCFAASMVFAATVARAQQQALPQPVQPGQPAAALQQAPDAQAPIGTTRDIVNPENRFGQQRASVLDNAPGQPVAAPDRSMLPTANPSAAAPRIPAPQMMNDARQSASQRGELGVWLVASGGPGVEIRRVTIGSAADEAGLQQGDVILQVNGQDIASPGDAQRAIRQIAPGQMAMLEIWRNGEQQQIEANLRPARESTYQVGFRGDESASNNGLASRTMRLEEQVGMLMQEVQRMRQEMVQMRASAGSQSTSPAPAALPATSPFDEVATPTPTPNLPASTDAAVDDAFGEAATAPADTTEIETEAVDAETATDAAGTTTETDATATESTATDDAIDADTDADADTEADGAKNDTETEADSGSLFE